MAVLAYFGYYTIIQTDNKYMPSREAFAPFKRLKQNGRLGFINLLLLFLFDCVEMFYELVTNFT